MFQRALRQAAQLIRELATNLPAPDGTVLPRLLLSTAAHPLDQIMEEIEVRHVGLYQAIARRSHVAEKAIEDCYRGTSDETWTDREVAARFALEDLAGFLERWADEPVSPYPRIEQAVQRLPDELELRILRALAGERVAQNLYTLQETSGISRSTISKRLPPMVTLGWVIAKPRRGVSITPLGRALLSDMHAAQSA